MTATFQRSAIAVRGKVLAPWLIGNILVVALIVIDLTRLDNGMIGGEAYWGRDFINLWTAGRLAVEGRLDLIYDLHAYHAFQVKLFGPIAYHNYSYPPFALPLAVPFGLLPYGFALAGWLASTGALFIWAARPWWREATGLPLWCVVLTPAALLNVWAGHYGFLIGALFLFGWRLLPDRPLLAGACIALLAVKPHLGVLIPLALALRGEWRAIVAASVGVVLLVGVSLILFGVERWTEYFTVTIAAQATLIDADGGFFGLMSTSFATALLDVGFARAWAFAGQALLALIAVILLIRAVPRISLRDAALLTATATFLVLPYAFNYDLTVSVLAAAMLIQREDLGRWEGRGAILGFMAPQLGMAIAAAGAPAMPLLLLGLMIVQYRAAMRANR